VEGSAVDDRVPMGQTCQWCSAAAPVEATQCPSCGAALARRESIGDLVIPGVTSVDPALLDADGRPLHLPGASLSQGMAGGVMVAAMAGGPVGLAALGGLAAVGAAEYVGAGRRGGVGPDLDGLGRPSSAALELVDRLDHKDAPPADNDPWRDDPGRTGVPPTTSG
jgi:ribosomal protein L40E